MHPNIEKFWNDANYLISHRHGDFYWLASSSMEFPFIVALTLVSDKFVKYSFEGKWYSEQEMLRIISLKAFL